MIAQEEEGRGRRGRKKKNTRKKGGMLARLSGTKKSEGIFEAIAHACTACSHYSTSYIERKKEREREKEKKAGQQQENGGAWALLFDFQDAPSRSSLLEREWI
jgi:hypothetical protein